MSAIDITQLLAAYQRGQPEAMERLFSLVYQELRRIAHRQLKNVWSLETICTTALVNEAYLKLVNHQNCKVSDRAHFFALAATAMRQILINYAEQKQADKRGGQWQQVTYEQALLTPDLNMETLLAVDSALKTLKDIDEDLARLVELRFFAGMTEAEIACVFAVTERTVRRNWKKAKALLVQALKES